MNRALDGEQELIVVDNASSEPPRAETAAWKGSGRLLELERNVGFGAASNAGVAGLDLLAGLGSVQLLDPAADHVERLGGGCHRQLPIHDLITSESIATGFRSRRPGRQTSAGRIWRRRRTRSSIGGWVENRPAIPLPLNGLTM